MKSITSFGFILLCQLSFSQIRLNSSNDSLRISILQASGCYGVHYEIYEILLTKDTGYLKQVVVPSRTGIKYASLNSKDCKQILEQFNQLDINSIKNSQPVDSNYLYTTATGSGSILIEFSSKKEAKLLKSINYIYPASGETNFFAFYNWLLCFFSLPKSTFQVIPLDSFTQKKYLYRDFNFTSLANSFNKPNTLIYLNKNANLIDNIITESIANIEDTTQIDSMISYLYSENRPGNNVGVKIAILKSFSTKLKSTKILSTLCKLLDSRDSFEDNIAYNLFQALINQNDCNLKFKYLAKGLSYKNRDIKLNCAYELAENGHHVAKSVILDDMRDNAYSGGNICYLLKIKDDSLLLEIYDIYNQLKLNSGPQADISRKFLLLGMQEIINPDKKLTDEECRTFLFSDETYRDINEFTDYNTIERKIIDYINDIKNAR